jgi:hypothetical protein
VSVVSLSTRWHRLDAARWVHRLLILQAVLCGWLTVVVLFYALAAGMAWLALVPAALTALLGWLAHAWEEGQQRWTWWTVMTLAVLVTAVDLMRLGSGLSVLGAGRLLVDVAVLALLVHPDCSVRLGPPAGPRATTRTPGGGGSSAGRP